MKRVSVIGAGPAGLTSACQLAEQGFQVDLFEAASDVGGMAKSIGLWGQTVDLGPHRFFSKDTRVNDFWLELAGSDYRMVERLTRIYYKGRFYRYPLQLSDLLKNLPPRELLHAGFSYLMAIPGSARAEELETFEHWVVKRFGRRLFEIFFKSYSEKLWGIPCDRLHADFATQRIRRLSLSEVAKNLFGAKSRGSHRTLVDQFAYPLRGSGQIYQEMARRFVKAGGRLHLSCPVEKVFCENGVVSGVASSKTGFMPCDVLISSMPLTVLISLLPGTPPAVRDAAAKLRFRNTILVYLQLQEGSYFPDNWLYIHSNETATGRITNFRNWVPELANGQSETIVSMEYWCNFEDPLWSASSEELIAKATKELATIGLAASSDICAGEVIRVPRCYPVYDLEYKSNLQPIVDFISDVGNLITIGRYGAFKYNNQDHSIRMGLLAADRVVSAQQHDDLWHVNSDSDEYHEDGVWGSALRRASNTR